MFTTNILILGKTGVGKSSLLNYLFGSEVAATASGRPVTGRGIYVHPQFVYKKLGIVLYDSWGLEPDKALQWREYIDEEVRKNNEKDIRDWFHTIIYCVDASRSRVEDFEIEKILRPLEASGNKIIFVLTKCDVADPTKIQGVSNVLRQHFPNYDIIETCSVSKTLRNGRQTHPFHRELVFDRIAANLHENIFRKCVGSFAQQIYEGVPIIQKNMHTYYNKHAGILHALTDNFKQSFFEYFRTNIENNFRNAQKKLFANLAYLDNEVENIQYSFNTPAMPSVKDTIGIPVTNTFYNDVVNNFFNIYNLLNPLQYIINKIIERFTIEERLFTTIARTLDAYAKDIDNVVNTMLESYKKLLAIPAE